jgi:hypothetical protein
MNWEALGAIGELVSAIAVLATLVYLAVQVRHSRTILEENRKIALSEVYSQRAHYRLEQVMQNIDSPNIAKVLAPARGVSEEQFVIQEIHQRAIIHFDNMLYQGELGLIPEPELEKLKDILRSNYPLWEEDKAIILPRVKAWYEEDCKQNGDT